MKEILKKTHRKFHNTSGETIAETLVTMIVLSMAVLMLAGAVVTAARVNKQADNTDTAFKTGKEISGSYSVTITDTDSSKTISRISIPVRVYQTDNKSNTKYIYYEKSNESNSFK